MIDQPDLLHQLPAIILAGACTYVWLVARDRRKAVDRFNGILYERLEDTAKDQVRAEIIQAVEAAGCMLTPTHRRRSQDAAGRVIARSVERLAKKGR